ncbi:tRNA pseudouridine(38-40) synthase TruA [Paenibacillus hunanensis]|uniref:tRNA pseudouridine synthase A n=1 Tax=Paenibacillus hunanensis TaxID=539262 RepID=A0ABU1J3U7_9BACL|nr:tRNA pseudouridine(38-40) synthase TruA [Paenibacillus hunanensis]MDR6246180.1 tRNA pseudouridine38-40 synthase [Paenibacillus hunanensis]GGJ08727.1 tRNA pseudouridine synthase A 2 [Paenibacillus hunanensis]
MNNYKLTIQYDGNRYKGWQRLGDSDSTIQGKIEKAISVLIGEQIEIIGSSRTDAGVHALQQVANFKTVQELTTERIMSFLNHYLPPDISVIQVEQVDERFHARFHATEKTYLYKIWNREYSQPFLRKYSMHVVKPLDIEKMKQAAAHFIGEHDFTAYANAKSKKKDSVRTIHQLELSEQDGMIELRVTGNGFLYNMVRKMVGTLIAVGLGEKQPNDVPGFIQSKDRSQTGGMADAEGLYLEQIRFKNEQTE